ncbi:MAG: nicotinate-nucleotide adenylyltransferase [Candidatus Omnitrophota bacterium]
MTTRIGILGGTFDPVHNGHLHLAKKACDKLRLSKVIFVPSYLPPHKKGAKVTPARHRCNMLRLAIKGNEKFRVSDMEIKRKGRSYTVDTLRSLRKKFGAAAELFFITGSDSLKELNKWKDLEKILSLCSFVIVERPRFRIKKTLPGLTVLRINAKDISSTMARGMIKRGGAAKDVIPNRVSLYIDRHNLY